MQYSGFHPVVMRRLWQMLAHHNGQTVNYSALGNSLGVSNVTIRNYMDLLEGTFMIEVVRPMFSNLGKRLVKAPKVYINDPGITNALLGLSTFDQLAGHPALGSVWEQVVLMHLKAQWPEAGISFYRTSGGAELDLVLKLNDKTFAVECKASRTPVLTRGNYSAIEDVKPLATLIVAPVEKGYEAFKLGFLLQQARLEKGMTQEELAAKCGTNKGYISKIENNLKEVRISTLQKIVELGLGGHLELSIRL
jgi:DNA-binding XRE family transcriptional regulator